MYKLNVQESAIAFFSACSRRRKECKDDPRFKTTWATKDRIVWKPKFWKYSPRCTKNQCKRRPSMRTTWRNRTTHPSACSKRYKECTVPTPSRFRCLPRSWKFVLASPSWVSSGTLHWSRTTRLGFQTPNWMLVCRKACVQLRLSVRSTALQPRRTAPGETRSHLQD